jgi:hypothetical protein
LCRALCLCVLWFWSADWVAVWLVFVNARFAWSLSKVLGPCGHYFLSGDSHYCAQLGRSAQLATWQSNWPSRLCVSRMPWFSFTGASLAFASLWMLSVSAVKSRRCCCCYCRRILPDDAHSAIVRFNLTCAIMMSSVVHQWCLGTVAKRLVVWWVLFGKIRVWGCCLPLRYRHTDCTLHSVAFQWPD